MTNQTVLKRVNDVMDEIFPESFKNGYVFDEIDPVGATSIACFILKIKMEEETLGRKVSKEKLEKVYYKALEKEF